MRAATVVVQTTVSALATPRTAVPVTPAVSTHFAEAAATLLVIWRVAEESTALRNFCGKAIVTLPPIGTTVTGVNMTGMATVFAMPGALAAVIAVGKVAKMLPRTGVAAVEVGLNLSVEVATLNVPAI